MIKCYRSIRKTFPLIYIQASSIKTLKGTIWYFIKSHSFFGFLLWLKIMMNCLFLEASSCLICLLYCPIVEEYSSSLCLETPYYWWLVDNWSSYYLCIATKNDCYSAFNTILSDWAFSYLINLSFIKEGESFGLYYVTTDQEWLMNVEMGEQITRSPSWGMWSTTRREFMLA